jgi:hypothetical protein
VALDDKIREVYKVFSPSPLTVDQKDLYVNLDDVRGDADIVKRLSSVIRLSTESFSSQVLAGHNGCGKSTELMRIRADLELGDPKYFVVFCDVFENLDLNDVDFPDLLLDLVRQIADALRSRAGIELKPSYPREVVERLNKLLHSEVGVESVEIGSDLAKITGTIKNSPDMRQKVREALEPFTDTLLSAANDVIGAAVSQLSKQGYAGIVLLVDNLDKMPVRPKENSNCDTAEYLFINRAAQMTALNCHVIYTIPLSLAYSHQEQVIKNRYGGHLPLVPATKVVFPPPESGPCRSGVAKFREIVRKRLQQAGMSVEETFGSDSEGILGELIALSGGQPTELMTIVREALVSGGLPITAEALYRAKKEGQREYSRILLAEHIEIIEEVARDGEYARKSDTEEAFRQLLNSRAILQYVNDKEWYGLNPMVKELMASRRPGEK